MKRVYKIKKKFSLTHRTEWYLRKKRVQKEKIINNVNFADTVDDLACQIDFRQSVLAGFSDPSVTIRETHDLYRGVGEYFNNTLTM